MIKSAIKRFGFWGFIENVVIHCFQKIGVDFCVMEIYACGITSGETYSDNNIVKVLELKDFENQAKLNSSWFTPHKIEDMKSAFNLGDNIAVGIIEDGMIISYGWLSLRTFGLNNIRLKKSDGYLWDDYTHPNYRGNGLHSKINQARVELLRDNGKNRALTQVAHYNRASRVGYLRNGFSFLTSYIQLKIGHFEYSTLKYNND